MSKAARVLIVAVSLALAACSISAARVTPVDAPQSVTKEGVYYALPRTIVTASVPFKKSEVTLTPLGKCLADAQAANALVWAIFSTDPRARAPHAGLQQGLAASRASPQQLWQTLDRNQEAQAAGDRVLAAVNAVRTDAKAAPLTLNELKEQADAVYDSARDSYARMWSHPGPTVPQLKGDVAAALGAEQQLERAGRHYVSPSGSGLSVSVIRVAKKTWDPIAQILPALQPAYRSTRLQKVKDGEMVLDAANSARPANAKPYKLRTLENDAAAYTAAALQAYATARGLAAPPTRAAAMTIVRDALRARDELARADVDLAFRESSRWPERWLGISLKPSVSYSLDATGVAVASRHEADPRQVYHVDLDGGVFEERDVQLQMTALGILTKGVSASTDKGPAVVAQSLQLAGKIVGGSLGISNVLTPEDSKRFMAPLEKEEETENPFQEAWRLARFDESCEHAFELAWWLSLLRQTRISRHLEDDTGVGPFQNVRGDGLKEELTQRDALIKSLQDAFRKSADSTWTLEAEYRPNASCCPTVCGPLSRTEPLCHFDTKKGISVSGNASVVPPGFRAKVPSGRLVNLHLEWRAEDQIATKIQSVRRRQAPRYLHYRVPVVVDASVRLDRIAKDKHSLPWHQILGARPLAVAQLGAVGALPWRLQGGGVNYTVELHEALGSIKTVALKTQAADLSGVLEAAGQASDAIFTAEAARLGRIQAQRDAVPAPTPEKSDIEKDIERLKLELERATLENQLEEALARQRSP